MSGRCRRYGRPWGMSANLSNTVPLPGETPVRSMQVVGQDLALHALAVGLCLSVTGRTAEGACDDNTAM
jgi:hypothetical protein